MLCSVRKSFDIAPLHKIHTYIWCSHVITHVISISLHSQVINNYATRLNSMERPRRGGVGWGPWCGPRPCPRPKAEGIGRGHIFFLQSSILNARGRRPRAFFFFFFSNFHLASGFIYSTSRVFFEKIDFVLGLRPRAKSIFSKNTLLVE